MDSVKKYEIKGAAQIKENKCELCEQEAITGLLNDEQRVCYACSDHVKDLLKKIRKA